jgi:hypothetical protein
MSIAWPNSDEACFQAFSVDEMVATGLPIWLDNPADGTYAWFADVRRRRLDTTCDCSVSCECATGSGTFNLVAPAGGNQGDGSQGQGAGGSSSGLPIFA